MSARDHPTDSRAGLSPAARTLFTAQLVSVSGDRFFSIALVWWLVSRSDLADRELTLGLLLAVSTLPAALAGPLLGPIIDRVDRRSCMLIADLGRLVLVSALAYALHRDALSIPILFLVCLPLFAFNPLFDAAASASLPQLSTAAGMLERLIAIESAIPNVAAALGALGGSWLLAFWSIEGAFWFNAASFLVSFLFVARLPRLQAPNTSAVEPSEAGRGYRFLRRYPAVMRLLTMFGISNFFVVPVFLYLPLLVHDVLAGDGSDLGLLEFAFAAGSLGLYALFGLWPRRFRRTRWLRFMLAAAAGALLWMLGLASSLKPMAAILFVAGISVAFVNYLAVASFQHGIPDRYKGRFFALLTSICSAGVPLSFALFGYLSSRYPLPLLIGANAICVLVVSLGYLGVPDDRPPRTGC